MKKVLIVNGLLILGGAEKLAHEIACFAQQEGIKPEILILDNYKTEHYDAVFKEKGIKVIRTRINTLKHFRQPAKMVRSIYWSVKLKYFANRYYQSVHVIGLYNIDKIYDKVIHPHRFFWNVNNAVQFEGNIYPIQDAYFQNENDTIVCINKYSIDELHRQYNSDQLKARIKLFKLFLNDPD